MMTVLPLLVAVEPSSIENSAGSSVSISLSNSSHWGSGSAGGSLEPTGAGGEPADGGDCCACDCTGCGADGAATALGSGSAAVFNVAAGETGCCLSTSLPDGNWDSCATSFSS